MKVLLHTIMVRISVARGWHLLFARARGRRGTTAHWHQEGKGWQLTLRIWSSATSPTKCRTSQVIIYKWAVWYILWWCVDFSQVWLKNNLQYSWDTPPRLEVVQKHSVFCVCCAQRKVGTWTSWTILWSVWLNLPATILYALLPLSHMPATSIMAPVLFQGNTIKSYPLLILSNNHFTVFCHDVLPVVSSLPFFYGLFCSIEFDRDCDYFAIAGVTKKIKVFEYGTVIQDAVDIHYPVNEMTCNSKIR